MEAKTLIYRKASFAEIHPLRRTVLRPGDAFLKFDGDDGQPPHTWHFGAFVPMGENVGCLTLLPSSWQDHPALQLRGMAVAAGWRSRGVGGHLLRIAVETIAHDPNARTLSWWCNARVEAIGFYERFGWQIASEEFMIETVGLHRKMGARARETWVSRPSADYLCDASEAAAPGQGRFQKPSSRLP